MSASPLTLAALATSAVPDLDVSGYRLLNEHHPLEVSAILETTAGTLLVQLPITPEAEVHHSAKIMGQAALTEGVRATLPFTAPQVLGITRSGDTRAIVSTFVQGERCDIEELTPDALVLRSIVDAIAAIHELPFTVVTSQGLPNRTASVVRSDAARLIDRAYASGLMPEVVKQYWTQLLGDQSLWDFQPTVIHGSLTDSQLLVMDDRVVGVLDWAELSVGDPAADLAWMLGADAEVLSAALKLYTQSPDATMTAPLARRARFWHELGVARWLLHGLERQDQEVIDDAVTMFDHLVTRAATSLSTPATPARLSAEEVLDQVPQQALDLSDTDRFDVLDEERSFVADDDFGPRDPDETQPLRPLDDGLDDR